MTFGVRLLAAIGVRSLLLTNAAGAVAPGLAPGDLVRITDHLNLTGLNPLTGPNDDRLGPRFPDMTEPYDAGLGGMLDACGARLGVPLGKGVYAGLAGPSYETPAEIRMLRTLGADLVGMSTVLEVIAARHAGLRVAAVSIVTNLAAGRSGAPLSHAEVIAAGDGARDRLERLVPAGRRRPSGDPTPRVPRARARSGRGRLLRGVARHAGRVRSQLHPESPTGPPASSCVPAPGAASEVRVDAEVVRVDRDGDAFVAHVRLDALSPEDALAVSLFLEEA